MKEKKHQKKKIIIIFFLLPSRSIFFRPPSLFIPFCICMIFLLEWYFFLLLLLKRKIFSRPSSNFFSFLLKVIQYKMSNSSCQTRSSNYSFPSSSTGKLICAKFTRNSRGTENFGRCWKRWKFGLFATDIAYAMLLFIDVFINDISSLSLTLAQREIQMSFIFNKS